MNTTTLKTATVTTSIGLFLFSLSQKCYCTSASGCGDSLAVLLTGWMGVFTGTASTFPWLANPAIALGWIRIFKHEKESLIESIVAAALCFSFLFFDEIINDEGGHYSKITGYKIGYWAWAGSAILLLTGNVICAYLRKKAVKL